MNYQPSLFGFEQNDNIAYNTSPASIKFDTPPVECLLVKEIDATRKKDLRAKTRIMIIPVLRGKEQCFVTQISRKYVDGREEYKQSDFWPTEHEAKNDAKDWIELAARCDW